MAADTQCHRRFFAIAVFLATAAALLSAAPAAAQPGLFQPQGQQPGTPAPAGNGLFGPGNSGNNQGLEGGGANADFDSLIELIQSTVATDTWAENGGGEADIRPFPNGVFVDAEGTLRQVSLRRGSRDLGLVRREPPGELFDDATPQENPRRNARLRYVSLVRLEKEIARRQAAGEPLDQSMLTLAGLRRVQFVLLYPKTGDLVLAGPAGDWYVGDGGRIASSVDDQPVVRLDDLLALLRRELASPKSYFGCSITPRQESLAQTQAFLDESAKRPLRPGERKRWLAQLREKLGQQDIEIFGVDPTSRVARVLVEADYHMKLIGMGLADGVPGVRSYLATLSTADGSAETPLSVLRWWFAMRYRGLTTNAERNTFAIAGPGACVLSENELLTQRGQRVHTGQSDELTALFAHSFSNHFAELCEKYPLYTELRNVFDLALVAALIHSDGLAAQVGWEPSLFADAQRLPLPKSAVPRQVDTVVNHRVINRRRIVAGISGGVMVSPGEVLAKPRETEAYGDVAAAQRDVPEELAAARWWWDFE